MSEKIKILLVDDDPDFIEINRLVLEADGYFIEEALTAKEAIEKIRNGSYDLLIIDLIMEELDSGFTVAYAVREDDRVKDTPILLLTSAQEKTGFTFKFTNDKEWMKVDDLAAKPLKPAELRERVAKLLKRDNRDDQ